MSETFLFSGSGHMPEKANKIAKQHGAWLINHTDPGCSCGRGHSNGCPANRRHWFSAPNMGAPFDGDRARALSAALDAAGVKPKKR